MTTARTDAIAAATPPPAFDLYDQGLQADVATLVDRRRVLQLISLAGVGAVLAACTPGASATASAIASAAASPASSAAAAACAPVIPEETAGPFPGDGTNGPDVLTDSGVVRSDITTSFGASSGTAEGIPLTIRLLHPERGERLRAAGQCRRLPVALRPRGPVLALLAGRRGPELPARRPGGRCRRHRHLHQHLPGLLLGPLAARPLRDLPVDRRRGGRRQQDRDLADRAAQGHLRPGLRDRRLRAERQQPRPDQPHLGHGVRRRRRRAPDRARSPGRWPTA